MSLRQEEQNGKIISREVRGCIVLSLNGACDDACADELGCTVDAMVESGHMRLILDLSRTKYVESSGFRIILNRLTRLHELGGQLVVTGLRGAVGRGFKLLKLDMFVPVAGDVTSAVRLLVEPERKAS